MTHSRSLSFSHLMLALLVTLLWGFNFVFAKAGVTHFEPFTMITIRLALVALLLVPFFPKPPISLRMLIPLGFTFTVLHIGCMYMSLHLGLGSAVGIVTEQIGVPFILLLSVILFKEKIGMKSMLGVAVAMVGTYFLMEAPNSIDHPGAFMLMIASAFFWAVYSMLLKRVPEVSVFALVGWISLCGVVFMLPLAWFIDNDHLHAIATADAFVWGSLLYTAIAASIGAHGLWYYLLSHNPVHSIAPITLLVPLFGIAGGVFILGEPISPEMLWGALLMTIGVGIVLIRKPRTVETDIDA